VNEKEFSLRFVHYEGRFFDEPSPETAKWLETALLPASDGDVPDVAPARISRFTGCVQCEHACDDHASWRGDRWRWADGQREGCACIGDSCADCGLSRSIQADDRCQCEVTE
jgi:hypothetical protein